MKIGPGKERGCATCGTTYRGRRPTEIELQGRRKESPAHMAVAVVAQWMPAYSKYGLAEDVQFNIVSPPQLSGGAFQQRREVSSDGGRRQGIGRRGGNGAGFFEGYVGSSVASSLLLVGVRHFRFLRLSADL